MQLVGSLADFTTARRDSIRQQFATLLGVDISAVTLDFADAPPSSVLMNVQVTLSSNAAAAAARATLSTALATPSSATDLVSTEGDTITVESIPIAPALAPTGSTSYVVESVVQLAGLAADFDAARRAQMAQAIADALGVSVTAVTLSFLDNPPSTMLTVQVTTDSPMSAATTAPLLQAHFGTAATAAKNGMSGSRAVGLALISSRKNGPTPGISPGKVGIG